MGSFLVHWLVTAISLVVADGALPGVKVGSGLALAVAALVLGFVNAMIRPVVVFLTLPLTVLTLGLFYLVVNGLVFGLAAALVPGFTVASLGSAIAGALIVGVVSWFIGSFLRRPEPRPGGCATGTTRPERVSRSSAFACARSTPSPFS